MSKTNDIMNALKDLGDAGHTHYEVAEKAGCSVGTAFATLKKLAEDGKVLKDKRGRNMIYKLLGQGKSDLRKENSKPVKSPNGFVLEDKILHFHMDRSRCGWYQGLIKSVDRLKSGKIRTITVNMCNVETLKFDGRSVRLRPEEFRSATVTVNGQRLDVYGSPVQEKSVQSQRSARARS